jgi:hypothetical protein
MVFPVKYMKSLLDEEVVQIFKSITAREIFSRKPSVKKHL